MAISTLTLDQLAALAKPVYKQVIYVSDPSLTEVMYWIAGSPDTLVINLATFADLVDGTVKGSALDDASVLSAKIGAATIADDRLASSLVKDPGRLAVGLVKFAVQADCTSITVGDVTYTYSATPDATQGQWGPHGGSAANSAIALGAGINGDTRNAGGPYYKAIVSTATVYIVQVTPGGNVTIARVGGEQPATVESMTGGGSAEVKQMSVTMRTVTATEGANVEVNIPLPFTPITFEWFVRDSTGARRLTVTDVAAIQASPARIKISTAGAIHIVATDVVVVIAQS